MRRLAAAVPFAAYAGVARAADVLTDAHPHAAALTEPPHAGPGTGSWSTSPRETGAAFQPDMAREGLSPKPTEPPRPQWGELLRRQATGFTRGPDTCGYIASYWDNAFTCVAVGASCTNDGTFMGCCTTTGAACFSSLRHTCLHYTDSVAGKCAGVDLHTRCCSLSESPSCYTYLFTTSTDPSKSFTIFDCDTRTGNGAMLDYPPSLTRSGSSNTGSSTTTKTKTASGTNPDGGDVVTVTSSATITPSSDSSTPVGPIVGGVVGGVAALGLGALGVFMLLRRRKDKDGYSPPPGQQAAMAGAGGAGGAGVVGTFPPQSPAPGFGPASPAVGAGGAAMGGAYGGYGGQQPQQGYGGPQGGPQGYPQNYANQPGYNPQGAPYNPYGTSASPGSAGPTHSGGPWSSATATPPAGVAGGVVGQGVAGTPSPAQHWYGDAGKEGAAAMGGAGGYANNGATGGGNNGAGFAAELPAQMYHDAGELSADPPAQRKT